MERPVDYEFDALKREFLAEARDKVMEIETTLDGDRSPDRIS